MDEGSKNVKVANNTKSKDFQCKNITLAQSSDSENLDVYACEKEELGEGTPDRSSFGVIGVTLSD